MQKLYLAGAAALLVIGISSTVAYNYRYHLYDLLPSTDESELTNTDGLIYDKNGKLFTGRVKDSTDTGYSIYSYKDGELDGLNVVFSEGKLSEIGHWVDGKQNGLFESWNQEGILIDHGTFKDGERDGQTVQYYPDSGNLRVKAQYKAGKLNGMVEQYYPSGKLQFKHNFVDNQLHGTALDYYENGVLKSKVNFELGVQNGPYQTFSESGKPLEEGSIQDGKRHGHYKTYFPDSNKVAMEANFKLGNLDGQMIRYRPDGAKVVQNYVNGKPDGYQKNYSPDGRLMGEVEIKDGRPTGRFKLYDQQGNLVEESEGIKN